MSVGVSVAGLIYQSLSQWMMAIGAAGFASRGPMRGDGGYRQTQFGPCI